MEYEIRSAVESDWSEIQTLYVVSGRPPRAPASLAEYLIASTPDRLLGCAGVRSLGESGYLYGLAVHPGFRRRGIGSALTVARVERLRSCDARLAIALAMFWNVRFFRNLGFQVARRADLPEVVLRLPDFQDATYRRSAVVITNIPPHSEGTSKLEQFAP
jgi:N-acetylglutamate synthase-like GNAT family acetyltransferase